MQKETHKKEEMNEKVNDFVQKHRTPVYVLLIFTAVLIVGFIVSYFIYGSIRKNANSVIGELNTRYESMQADFSEDMQNEELETLISDLETFAKKIKISGYAAGKVYGILADIYGKQKQWEDSEASWIKAAKKSGKSYLAPISWFNAAVAAEEQDKKEQAIEHYTKSVGTQTNFPAAVQAQFSIGRLKEELGDNNGAIEAYQALITGWSYDTAWTNIAHSRIIALETQKIEDEDIE